MTPKFTIPPLLKPYQRAMTLAGVKVFFYDSGQPAKQNFILLHGLGDEADSWRKVFPLLAGQGRVIVPDLPGFGRSGHPKRAYRLNFFSDMVAALLDALQLPQAVVVGNSMGGAVALRLALRRPDLPARLVLVDGPPVRTKINKAQLAFLLPGQGEKIYTDFRKSQDAAYASLKPYYANLDGLPAEDQAFLRERVWDRVWSDDQRRAYFSTFRWMALEGLLGHPKPSDLEQIKVPTRIVWGERDFVIGLESGKLLQSWIPGANLYMIPGSGHLPQQEHPVELVRLIAG